MFSCLPLIGRCIKSGSPLTFTLPHYTPGFLMCTNSNKGSIFFFNENDGQIGIIQLSGIITKKIEGAQQGTQTTHNNQTTQTTGQLTVAGFQVINFRGTVNPDGSFAGSGDLVIPNYGTVNATFSVDSQGKVRSGSWKGSFNMGYRTISISSGTITNEGLKGVSPLPPGWTNVRLSSPDTPGRCAAGFIQWQAG